MTTTEHIAEIRARLAAATPGPWVAAPWSTGIIGSLARRTACVATVEADGDKLFISHAPTDIAYLLSLVDDALSCVKVER